MKTVIYGNIRDRSGSHRPMIVGEDVAAQLKSVCEFHIEAGATPEDHDSIYVAVGDWDKALGVVRQAMQTGHDIYRLAKTI